MTSDVVLSAALRTNLLSLQNTQSLVDITQNRLATGKKINSALDGPQAFFASQALTNRASDLTRLLDSIGQSIQVIKAADNGITALTKLVEQADSIAQSARDALAQGQVEAKITGDRDLRDIDDLTALPGITDAGGDILTFSLTDEDGNAVNIGAYGAAATPTADITIDTNDSIDELIAEINNLHVTDGANALGERAFEASLDESGNLQIKTLDGGNFSINFVSAAAGTPENDAGNLGLAAELGLANVARLVPDGAAGTSNVEFTTISDVSLNSYALYNTTTGEIAQASSLLSDLEDSAGNALFGAITSVADVYQISINGAAVQDIELHDGTTGLSIQGFVDAINSNATLNTKIEASYDDETGVLNLKPIDGSVQSIEIGVASDDALEANFGFGTTDLTAGAAGEAIRETIRLAASAADLAQYEADFDNLREQITQLVTNGDTGYRGTNLLNGDDLLTIFNEDRTSSLTTDGVTFTADGLGLTEADFSRVDTTEQQIAQVREALGLVRGFGSTLANDLSVIQTRENFTKDIINTLTEGSDKLVNADQNEEGAKLLALQTRQSLGVTALSLASQSQQSILRLFQ
ncbi:MAG: flagellin N-terminal helical domain-containing protein [Micavibrio sp.]